MKKELIAVCAMACAAASFATEYTSENAIASLGVSTAEGKQMIAVPFKGFSADSITVSNVVACSNLAVGDKLYLAINGGYKAWVVASGTNGKYWNPTTDVTKTGVKPAPSASTTGVTRGDGFWLETSTATTAYLLGEKPSTDSTSVTLAQGLNLVGITSATTSKKLSAISGEAGDKIILTDGTTYIYGKTSEKWMSAKDYKDSSNVELAPGTGFWINAASSHNVTL